MSAPGRPRSGSTYPTATAFTNRRMPAGPGAIWASVNPGSSAASASIPTTPISSMSPHLATYSAPTMSAGSSDRATAAKPGAKCCIETPIRAPSVWPEESTGIAPQDMRYRFAWTFPIVFSPHDSGILYAAGNHVFRSRDEGMSWEEISPDLSLNDIARQGPSGGDITGENGGAEVHATCASLAPSPHRRGEIWASTDDGLVHVTRDDGKSWQNVTPAGMPELAYVGCVEISPHDADTIYVAATRYKLADYKSYLFRSTDGGRSFEPINGDFPVGEITRVVRADPVRRGLLFVGTETS